ncbi:uncharacterized protein LOC656151 [Tribolium castaneum]|uniref:Uncharacterized protein n=1 Tax=Tribolium castaneum TaxID=7070 RepID=D6WFH8_TRICA|nr:PREDICTED: uncharacterized protein LOC656672 [Tribolium castaneum]EEZ99817.2 hypothetical protein TcasGA2_TC002597 [Tribolium castaneum]|eukprot:XP_976207.1 PREDICTED: uncharacterized protein LOC656672 [Tribolium castaneum]
MGLLKSQALVLFATFTILLSGITAKHAGRPSDNNLNSLINNIFSAVLHSRGTSSNQILEKLISADGNVDVAVSGINAEIKGDLLAVDGDQVRVNQEELRNLLIDGIKTAIQEKSARNPYLAKILEQRFDQLYASQLVLLDESNAIPLSKIQELLEKTSRSRSKRDVQVRDFDLGTIISEILGNALKGQLVGLVNTLLEQVKGALQALYVPTPPSGNDFDTILTFVVNTLVKRALEIITVVQQNLEQIINILPSPDVPVNGTAPVSRRRRAVEEQPFAITAQEGLLDVIVRPVLELLASILTPVNEQIKTLVDSVLNGLAPIVGTLIITRIRNVIIALVDLLIPANPI